MKVFWTHMAYRRLEEIFSYIEKDSLNNAGRWVDKLVKKTNQLKDFPKVGRVVSEGGSANIREIIYGNYRIIYKVKDDAIYVLTVRHFKQILPIKEIEE